MRADWRNADFRSSARISEPKAAKISGDSSAVCLALRITTWKH